MDDLDVVRKELGDFAVSAKIFQKIKNTMSDRHTAEKLFCEILSDYRADILPEVVSEWEQMCEAEREQLTRMNNFSVVFIFWLVWQLWKMMMGWRSKVLECSVSYEQPVRPFIIMDLKRLGASPIFGPSFGSKV